MGPEEANATFYRTDKSEEPLTLAQIGAIIAAGLDKYSFSDNYADLEQEPYNLKDVPPERIVVALMGLQADLFQQKYETIDENYSVDTTYYFDDVDDLVEHLLYTFPDMTPLKLQKSLYMLFAFYIVAIRSGHETGKNIPDRLFKADFEAWSSGPVIRDVYQKAKNDSYQARAYNFKTKAIDLEIRDFIDNLVSQIMRKSDVGLMTRSREDKSWKNAIEKGKTTPISMDDIVAEYENISQTDAQP
jgi:uncharacterized phage-associated protein